jgi:hypothetical protein
MPTPPKIIDYKVIEWTEYNHGVFYECYLRKYLDDGYELQGGVNIAFFNNGLKYYSQTVVKRDYSVCK